MIARILIVLLLLLWLPQLYIDRRFLRRRWGSRRRSTDGMPSASRPTWKHRLARLACWLPTLLMTVGTLLLSLVRDFIPADGTFINLYLFLLGFLFVPKALFVLCAAAGRSCLWLHRVFGRRRSQVSAAAGGARRQRHNWGNLVGLVLAIAASVSFVWGTTAGVRKLAVRQVQLAFDDLPAAFDGYRIVLFSDAHVGTFSGRLLQVLQRDIDTINAQHPDAIIFAGDLQNLRPSELYPVQDMLARLQAPDCVFSVLGNHDYSAYIHDDPAIRAANEREMVSRQHQMGWTLLCNESRTISRGRESLVVAGEENGGVMPAADRDSLQATLRSVPDGSFVVMIQHDPSEWRRTILPGSTAQLTLSGHTHGGQFSLFGLRPTRLRYAEDYGLYDDGHGRKLYVTCGIGGLLPFRLGMPAEIVVIQLLKAK